MGMDVHGRKPTAKTGEYFCRSVWGWRPLADYIITQHPVLAEPCRYWHTNDGDGLTATQTARLADALQADLDNGVAARYITQRDERLKALPDQTCDLCDGTGKRQDPPNIGAGNYPCNGCNETGHRTSFETWYSLDLDDLRQMVEFLRDSGGFRIH